MANSMEKVYLSIPMEKKEMVPGRMVLELSGMTKLFTLFKFCIVYL